VPKASRKIIIAVESMNEKSSGNYNFYIATWRSANSWLMHSYGSVASTIRIFLVRTYDIVAGMQHGIRMWLCVLLTTLFTHSWIHYAHPLHLVVHHCVQAISFKFLSLLSDGKQNWRCVNVTAVE
jgi:hypothetical protein